MRLKFKTKNAAKMIIAMGIIGAAVFCTAVPASNPLMPASTAAAAASGSTNVSAEQKQMAIDTLNSFYKPALKGHFPGAVSGFTVGKSKHADVIQRFGQPDLKSGNFEGYTASMGSPGHSFAYKSGVLNEIRYFGTNVERQTNIGGITISMLWQQWSKPTHSTTIRSGGKTQIKVTYLRSDYKLDFIFNSKTDLDHINLTKA
ncbi:YjgB family protein [Paenibacillus sp. P96]|uniref:YjgB family protein n=1 Tax=Paenibacillus zeirhizosphaerae TaxID=2987519 RepID=A0ABT9FUV6_9BACL|nr:YjgB family protein [Paenibacillus sp. P96]MDP4098291.1 YjgB family protein [Paenibacillus sp. P96]